MIRKITWLVLGLTGISVVLAGGCQTATSPSTTGTKTGLQTIVAQTQESLVTTDEALANLKAEKAKVDQEIVTMPAGPKKDKQIAYAATLQKWITQYETMRSSVQSHLTSLNAALEKAETPVDAVLVAAREIAPFLPPPFGIIMTLGTILGSAAYATARKKAVLREKIIAAVDEGKDRSGDIILSDPVVADKVRAAMGSSGQAEVKKIRVRRQAKAKKAKAPE